MCYNNKKVIHLVLKKEKVKISMLKSKKLISIVALCLGFATFVSCTQTNYKVAFSDNWYSGSIPSSGDEAAETLEYKVSFLKGASLDNIGYTLSYNDGTYVTELTTARENGEVIYTYRSALNIQSVYTLNSVSETQDNTIESVVKFKGTANALEPVSSYKYIHSYSPNYTSPSKIEGCYTEYEYAVEITYSGNQGVSRTYSSQTETDSESTSSTGETNEITNEFSISRKKYTYLDNEQLLFALRGIDPAQNSSPKFNVYNPYTKMQRVKTSFDAVKTGNFTFLMEADTTATERPISYYPVSVQYDADNSGAAQEIWIAQKQSSNSYRNVILRMEIPLAYYLGSLVYELKKADFS